MKTEATTAPAGLTEEQTAAVREAFAYFEMLGKLHFCKVRHADIMFVTECCVTVVSHHPSTRPKQRTLVVVIEVLCYK